MDNKHLPPLEPENSLPEFLPEIPERMEPLEDIPVIEELSCDQDVPVEELQKQELPSETPEDEPVIQEIPIQHDTVPEEEDAFWEETVAPVEIEALEESAISMKGNMDMMKENTIRVRAISTALSSLSNETRHSIMNISNELEKFRV